MDIKYTTHNITSQEDKPEKLRDVFSGDFISEQAFKQEPDTGGADKNQEIKTAKISKIHFDILPLELERYLDQYVIKQHEAKEVLSTKICTHFHRVKSKTLKTFPGSIKNNILMLGPTGIGKTYIVKLIADKIGVPFVKSDATKFSETGYVGRDVEDLIRELIHEAGGDIELAEHGIVYIDEIDKIASAGYTYGPDVSRTGVQRNLLKLMEETEVDLKSPTDLTSQMEMALKFQKTGKIERKRINTRNILFIMSGAFSGLKEIIEKRLNKQNIGFNAEITSSNNKSNEILKHVAAVDLINYGFESEFIGRLPVVVALDNLNASDLYQILKNPNCPIIMSKKHDFKSYGIDLRFTDEAFHKIAEKAYDAKTGARALVSVMEKILLKFEKTLPSKNINKLVVTDKICDNPVHELEEILCGALLNEQNELHQSFLEMDITKIKNEITKFQENYKNKNHEDIFFSEEGISFIIEKALYTGNSINEICAQIIKMRQQIKRFEKDFIEKFNIHVSFNIEAMDLISKKAMKENVDAMYECHEILKNYELGLKLVQSRTGKNDFLITGEVVKSPESYLNNLIKTSFGRDNEF
ncbi:MAG: AAA family ATPase [Candidatus Firestonebacteria bacterium]|nr:AAA family ATPase [Candidatus Firestonebacteria bacterium]